jgi:hypothetical protein
MSDSETSPWVPIRLENAWVVEYRAEPSGVLRFAPAAIEFRYRFFHKHVIDSEGISTLGCRVQVADAEGRLWEAESIFTPEVFLERWIDLSRVQAPYWLANAPEEWRRACEEHVLLAGIGDGSDDRSHRYFYFDLTAFYFRFKHFGIAYDLVRLEGTRLLVRISYVFGSWVAMPIEGPDGRPQIPPAQAEPSGEEGVEFAWLDNLDPMVFELDCRHLLFRNTACVEDDDHPFYVENEIPLPVVFRRVDGEGEPQSAVTIQPRRSVLMQPFPVAPGADFVEVILENGADLELPVASGGCLRRTWGGVRVAFRLDTAPGSAAEPVDVLRCVTRLADDRGDLWQAQSLFTPEVFLERMVDPAKHRQPLADEEADRQWDLRKDNRLLSGIRGRLEGNHRYFLTTDHAVAVVGANQPIRFDVAGQGRDLLVRVTGLTGVRWPLTVNPQDEYAGLTEECLGKPRQEGPLPPLVYQIDIADLLFRNTTFAVDDGFWHLNDLPIPLLWERIEGKGEPQDGVRYYPDTGPAIAP